MLRDYVPGACSGSQPDSPSARLVSCFRVFQANVGLERWSVLQQFDVFRPCRLYYCHTVIAGAAAIWSGCPARREPGAWHDRQHHVACVSDA